ncbi:MAG: adenylate/guanylate cyclase domain-containing protein [Pseudomonadales bacterium]
MFVFDKFISYIFPLSLLEGTPWLRAWKDKEREDFVAVARIFFPVAALLYLGHFVFFDLAMGLEPKSFWLKFRASMATVAMVATLFYLTPWCKKRFYRAPAIIVCLLFCYFQGRVVVWYPEAPWLYCFLFVGICSLLLKASIVISAMFAAVAISLQWASLLEANIAVPVISSAAAVTLILILASRSGYTAEIRYFLLSQQNIASQKKNIEMNIEFTDRIKSFIPGEIAKRLEEHLSSGRMTVLQAIDEVLRPKKQNVACLFSDIRGFTEASKDLDEFIGELVLPNVKACTSAIDENGGVPRKIGDLIFAYFDTKSAHHNLLNAVMAALQISKINQEQSSDDAHLKVERYILLATGEAFVGNIGGFDSSVEITALGSPVNLLSRIDEITKLEKVSEQIRSGDIIFSQEAFSLISELGLRPEIQKIDLRSMGITIRNFPEESVVYAMSPTANNQEHFLAFFNLAIQDQEHKWNERTGEAA